MNVNAGTASSGGRDHIHRHISGCQSGNYISSIAVLYRLGANITAQGELRDVRDERGKRLMSSLLSTFLATPVCKKLCARRRP